MCFDRSAFGRRVLAPDNFLSCLEFRETARHGNWDNHLVACHLVACHGAVRVAE